MLVDAAYGKSKIRLVQVRRGGNRHTLRDLTVGVRFEGDYEASYADGDNRDVLPTDTMKNPILGREMMGACSDRYPPSRVVVVLRSAPSPGRSDRRIG